MSNAVHGRPACEIFDAAPWNWHLVCRTLLGCEHGHYRAFRPSLMYVNKTSYVLTDAYRQSDEHQSSGPGQA